MKNILSIVLVGSILLSCGTTKKTTNDLAISNPIVTSMDLTKVVDDKVPVVINPGRFTTETVTYHLPKVVQGTYSVSSFGRFVDDFKAAVEGELYDSPEELTASLKKIYRSNFFKDVVGILLVKIDLIFNAF